MATIKIPSKNIFSIDNQKVVDNQIDKIEVRAKNAVISVTEKTVFNDNIISYDSFQNEKSNTDGGAKLYQGVNITQLSWGNARLKATHRKYKIEIPKRNNGNFYVQKIIGGTSDTGISNIKYSITGTKETDKLVGGVEVRLRSYTAEAGAAYITETKNYKINTVNTEIDKDTIIEYTDTLKEIVLNENTLFPVNISISDLTNVEKTFANFDEDNDCYVLEFQILTDLERYFVSGQVKDLGVIDFNTDYYIPLTGSQEKYIANQVSLSVNGIVVGLNIEDKIIKINDGNNIISFDGNELMQKTNNPALEDTYSKVVKQYKNGKEIATIKCSIDDYYYTNGQKAIDIKKREVANNIDERVSGITGQIGFSTLDGTFYTATGEFDVGINGEMQDLTISQSLSYVGNKVEYDKATGKIKWTIYGTRPSSYVSAKITGKLIFRTPMSFRQYDKVVPYVYGANGEDRPMSTHINGKPKVFEVLSTRKYYDGAVWQELVLVESNDSVDE